MTRGSHRAQFQQNVFLSLVVFMLGVFVNVFHTVADQMALYIGRPALESGLLISTYALGSLVSLLLSSALSDRIGKRRVILSSLSMISLGFLLLALAQGEGLLLTGLFCFGFGFAPTEALTSAVLGDENPEKASLWINISQAGFGLGAILGPILALLWLGARVTYHGLFLALCPVALALAGYLAISGRERLGARARGARQSLNMFSVLKDGRFRLLALTIFLYLGYESVSPSYIKQYFLASGGDEDLAALMISLFWATMIVGRLIGTRLTGREIRSIRAFSFISVLGFALLVAAPSASLRVLAVCLVGLGCGPIWPMLVALAAQRFPARSGAAVGMMMLCSMAGFTVFPPLIGTLPKNLKATFILCAFLAGLVFLVTLLRPLSDSGEAGINRQAPAAKKG